MMQPITVAPGIVFLASVTFILLVIGIIAIAITSINKLQSLQIPVLKDEPKEIKPLKKDPDLSFEYKLDNMILSVESRDRIWSIFLMVGNLKTDTLISGKSVSLVMLAAFKKLKVTQKQSCFGIPDLQVIE